MAKQNKITIVVESRKFKEGFTVFVENNILFNNEVLYQAENCSSYLTAVSIVKDFVEAIMTDFDGVNIDIEYLSN